MREFHPSDRTVKQECISAEDIAISSHLSGLARVESLSKGNNFFVKWALPIQQKILTYNMATSDFLIAAF